MKVTLLFCSTLAIGALSIFLALRMTAAPASAHVSALTVNPTGTVSSDGFKVGLSGTLTCTAGERGFIDVIAFQFTRGQVLIGASGFASFNCSGVVQTWAVTAESFLGFFKPGHANVRVSLVTFADGFDADEVAAQVRLRRGLPPPESPPESPPQSPSVLGKIGGTTGAVGGAVALGLLATGMTTGFVKVLGRKERRDDIDI